MYILYFCFGILLVVVIFWILSFIEGVVVYDFGILFCFFVIYLVFGVIFYICCVIYCYFDFDFEEK